MKKKIIISLLLSPIVILFLMWAINKYYNEKQFDEDRAQLFDESMNASYLYISASLDALFDMIDCLESLAQESYKKDKVNYYKTLEESFWVKVKYDPQFRKSYDILNNGNSNLFLGSAVYEYMSNAGSLREEESYAVNAFVHVLLNCSLSCFEEKSYDEAMVNLEDCWLLLMRSKMTLRKYKNTCSHNPNACNEIDTLEKLEIWKRYNARKNWPFTFLNDD